MAELDRVDIHPTHELGGFKCRPGRPLPFGASRVPGGVNFSIFSRHATACTLVLFNRREPAPMAELPIPDEFIIGNVWSIVVFGLDYENVEYGYRLDGPWAPAQGHRFDPRQIVLDPYAKVIGGRDVWGQEPDWNDLYQHRGRLVFDDFDWEDERPLALSLIHI